MIQKRSKNNKRIPIEKIILGVIGTAGLLTVAVVAPNALQALTLFENRKKRHWSPYYINSALGKLQKKGWVVFQNRHNKKYVRLTKQGKVELLKYTLREKTLTKKRWDGVWRMIIFDIKERKRAVRDKIRVELRALGFIQLQQSVWVFPYPCEEVAIMLKADNKIGREVLYVEANRVENDRALRKHFKIH